MIKTPLSTVIGGAFWTPGATVIGGQQSFSQLIKKLFANGEQGFFYDPNDLSTMFQDAAGTIPVTGAGQPVGLILDKSGRNNHAFQANSAPRPILRKNAVTGANYLEFDGSDDFLQTSYIDFTGTDKVSLFAGVRTLIKHEGVILESSANSNTSTGNLLVSVEAISNSYLFRSKGTTGGASRFGIYPAPHSAVLTAKAQISTDLQSLSVNGVFGRADTDQGTGNYGNYPLYIGRRAGTSLPFNGHIYSLIGVGKLVSDSETAAIEKELAKRTGVTLSV